MKNNSVVTIVNFGIGNILSIQRGFEYFGVKVVLATDGDVLLKAERVVLPGVGAFRNAMGVLNDNDFIETITEIAQRGTPLLGICLGMQLLCDSSEEHDITSGFGLLSGRVVRIPSITRNGGILKVPQIGWNELGYTEGVSSWEGTILQNFSTNDSVYFVHSFMVMPENNRYQLAHCFYGGNEIVAVVQKDNIIGCQFHPEKSGEIGLKFLHEFMKV
jgi:imidazole glycerol-phosphate synthase subunit HisH